MTTNRITIALTGRAPVSVTAETWPVIATGSYNYYDGQVRSQSNHRVQIDIKARRHADGRAIVAGSYEYETNFLNIRDEIYRVGRMAAAGDDLAVTIEQVGRDLVARMTAARGDDAQNIADVVAECVNALPAESLD